MKLDDFNSLTDEEKAAFLKTAESDSKQLQDLTIERDSLLSENTTLKEEAIKTAAELRSTKELNFTLARKIDTNKQSDPDEVFYKFIKGER